MKSILAIAAAFVVLSFGALGPASAKGCGTATDCKPCCAQAKPQKPKIVGYKMVRVPIYQKVAPAPVPAQPCCTAPAQSAANATDVPVEVHVRPRVIVETPEIIYRPVPVVRPAPDVQPCPPKATYTPKAAPCCGQGQQVALAAQTDDGWKTQAPNMSPPGSYPCTKMVGGVEMHGHCWK